MDPAKKQMIKEILKFLAKILVTGLMYSVAARIWRLE